MRKIVQIQIVPGTKNAPLVALTDNGELWGLIERVSRGKPVEHWWVQVPAVPHTWEFVNGRFFVDGEERDWGGYLYTGAKLDISAIGCGLAALTGIEQERLT